MAHEVETMMYAGETPWHGLGTKLEGQSLTDIGQVLKAAGLDWQVEKVKMVTADTGQHIPNKHATRRMSDGSILGVVGDRYTVLQNHEAMGWFDPWLQGGQAVMETAGALGEGSRVFMLAKLNLKPIEIAPDDAVEKYILLSHSHDGSLSLRVGFTPIRVVCNNTLALAHKDHASSLIRIKHSRSIHENLNNIQEVMNLADQQFEATAVQYRRLQQTSVNRNDIAKYLKQVMAVGKDESVTSGKMANILTDIWGFIEGGKGNDRPGVRGTAWGMYNGMNEWLNYGRGSSSETRLSSLWYGPNAKLNDKALACALEMCV